MRHIAPLLLRCSRTAIIFSCSWADAVLQIDLSDTSASMLPSGMKPAVCRQGVLSRCLETCVDVWKRVCNVHVCAMSRGVEAAAEAGRPFLTRRHLQTQWALLSLIRRF